MADVRAPIFVGWRLSEVRHIRGFSVEALSRWSGVNEKVISRAESGLYSADTLVKLNRVLDSSLDYILYGDGAP